MNIDNLVLLASLVGFLGIIIGWLIRVLRYRREVKAQASETLKTTKVLLEQMISKTEDATTRQKLSAQLEETNSALLALYSTRLRRALKEASLPPEEAGIIDYNRFLHLRSDDPVILMNRGITYRHLGRYGKALADFNRSLNLRLDDPVILMNRGITYRHLGRYEEALADFNRSLNLRLNDPVILMNRGITYRHLGRYEEALADFNHSLNLRLDDPDTLYNRGITYTHLAKYDAAVADFNRCLHLRPDYPIPLYNLASLYLVRGETDEALIYLKEAISADKRYRDMARTSKAFDSIRGDPRFKKLIEPD